MNESLETGTLLIADPFLKDPNFMRTVVFLCDHQAEGSIGFVINRRYEKNIGELVTELEMCDFPVYYGGPVQKDTLHFLHRCPYLIEGGVEITEGIYWGGNFEQVAALIKKGELDTDMVRFYLGYSGWGEEQLDTEISENTWLVTPGNTKLVFHKNISLIWQDALKQLGGKYEQLINYPLDPQLN